MSPLPGNKNDSVDVSSVGGSAQNNMPKSSLGRFKNPKFVAISVIVLVLVLAAAVFLLKTFSNQQKVFNLATQGQKDFNSGRYQDARKDYQLALQYGSDPKLLAGVINSIAAQGNRTGKEAKAWVEAKDYISTAIKSAPNDKEVLASVGYMLETNGRYQEALPYYQGAIDRDKNYAQGWFHKGHTLEFLGKTDEAAAAYDRAFQLDPNDPQVLLARGNNLVSKKDLDGAYKNFLQIAKLNVAPAIRAEALTDASVIKRTQGYIKESLDLSTQAVNLDNRSAQVLSNHGINQVISGDLNKGVNSLYAAMKTNVRSAQPYWWTGIALRSVKRYDEAIKYQKTGLEMVDNDNTLVGANTVRDTKAMMTYDLGKTYWMAGRNQEALQSLKDAVNISSSAVKPSLKQDFGKNDFFKGLEGDPNFQALLN